MTLCRYLIIYFGFKLFNLYESKKKLFSNTRKRFICIPKLTDSTFIQNKHLI